MENHSSTSYGIPCENFFDPQSVTGYRTRTGAIVIWSLYSLVWLVSIVLYFTRRKTPLIRLRSPNLSVTSSLGGYIVVAIFLAEQTIRVTWGSWVEYSTRSGIVGLNSVYIVLAYLVFMVMFMVPYPLRALRLLLMFKRHVKIEKLFRQPLVRHHHNQDDQCRGLRRCCSWIRSLCKKTFGSRASESRYMLVLIIFLFLFVGYGFFTNQYTPQCQDMDPKLSTYSAYGVMYGLIVVIFVIALVLLRNVRDEFTINNELRVVSLSSILLIIPWAILAYIERSKMQRMAFPPSYLMVIYIIICHTMTIIVPMFMAFFSRVDYEKIRLDATQTDGVGSTLDSILHNEIASFYFRNYLASVLSTENYDFYTVVDAFKKKFSETNKDGRRETTETLFALAVTIHNQYVIAGATEQINLPDDQRKIIEKTLNDLDTKDSSFTDNDRSRLREIYDESMKTVLRSLDVEHMMNFRVSQKFIEMQKQLSVHAQEQQQTAVYIEMTGQEKSLSPQYDQNRSEPEQNNVSEQGESLPVGHDKERRETVVYINITDQENQ